MLIHDVCYNSNTDMSEADYDAMQDLLPQAIRDAVLSTFGAEVTARVFTEHGRGYGGGMGRVCIFMCKPLWGHLHLQVVLSYCEI
jgi:hypothetical protein